MRHLLRYTVTLGVVCALTLTGCGKKDRSTTTTANDSTVTSLTSTTLAPTPAAAASDSKQQLQSVTQDLDNANNDLTTAKKATDDGEGDVQ